MGKHRNISKPLGDYSTGYRRPPVEAQFQPGKSGNPRGRPKGVKTLGKQLADALARRVTVQENGKSRTMRLQDVIIQGVVNDAARREPRAVRLLFSLIDRYGDGRNPEIDADTLLPDDEAIINSYIASIQVPDATDDSASSTPGTDEPPDASGGATEAGEKGPHE